MKYQTAPGTAIFAPLSENVGNIILKLENGSAFGQVEGSDSVFVDGEATPLSPSRERGVGVGFFSIEGGNLLLTGNTKKAYIVESIITKNITTPTLQKLKIDGTKENISSYPAFMSPGEHLVVGGTASDVDNIFAIHARLQSQGDAR
jgi:hypothetical protein